MKASSGVECFFLKHHRLISGAALLPLKRSQAIALSSCLLCISQPTGMTLTSVIFLNFTLEADLEVNFNLDDF